MSLTAQRSGEFYTINHDTQVMLKSSKKADPLTNYYAKPELEDLLIFRNGIDRPIKLRGNVDFLSNNVDFDLLSIKHIIPLESVDSVFVGEIPENLKGMIIKKYVNGSLFDDSKDFFLELIVDGELKLYKRTKVQIRRANYNKALSIGSKKDKYQIKLKYFIYAENRGLLEVPKKSKSFLKLIKPYKGAASFYTKRKLSHKKVEDLELLITYINKNNYDK
jgi:hypothetical protein